MFSQPRPSPKKSKRGGLDVQSTSKPLSLKFLPSFLRKEGPGVIGRSAVVYKAPRKLNSGCFMFLKRQNHAPGDD